MTDEEQSNMMHLASQSQIPAADPNWKDPTKPKPNAGPGMPEPELLLVGPSPDPTKSIIASAEKAAVYQTYNPVRGLPKPQAKDEDYEQASTILQCEPTVLRAICTVESNGYGFDRTGFPTILVEPHIIWKHASFAQRRMLAPLKLAYPKWGTCPYGTFASQSIKFQTIAGRCGLELAILGTSFGLTQILGENYSECGCHTALEFYAKACNSEADQISLTAHLLLSMGLASALRNKVWVVIAQHWNGAGYAKNKYDQKLAAAYAALQRSYNKSEHTRFVPSPMAPNIDTIRLMAVYPMFADDGPRGVGTALPTDRPPRGYEVESIGWIDRVRAKIGV